MIIDGLKKCSRCEIGKPTSEYHKNRSTLDGFSCECKSCKSKVALCYNEAHKEQRKTARARRKKLKLEVDILCKKRYYVRKSRDPKFRFKDNIRSMIRGAFKRNGAFKTGRTSKILGCDFDVLVKHIESQFEPWMTWDKLGRYNGKCDYGFDIDHIIPLASASTKEDIIRLNHYTNLQPLCSYINRVVKRDRIDFKKTEICYQH